LQDWVDYPYKVHDDEVPFFNRVVGLVASKALLLLLGNFHGDGSDAVVVEQRERCSDHLVSVPTSPHSVKKETQKAVTLFAGG
jgi:hypothetical protein